MCYWTLAATFASKNAQNARQRCSLASHIALPDHLHCSEHAAAAVRRRSASPHSARPTMQAATLVALLIPVVAIWITVVVRYGRSIEEIVVATTIEKEE